MNIDEMKAGWNVMNERLAQNEILNKRMIKEMITAKTKSAYDNIYRFELKNFYVVIFVGIILLPGNILLGVPVKWCSFIFLEAVMLLVLLFQSFLIYILSKFSLSYMNVNDLTRYVLRYKKYYYYNKKYGTIIGLSSVVIFMILENTITKPYAIMFTLLMLVIGGIYTCTKVKQHEQQVREIERGLAELKEFED